MNIRNAILIFSVFFFSSCGPSPSNDLFSIEDELKAFKKSDGYYEFWNIIETIQDNREAFSDEDIVKANWKNINIMLSAMGSSAVHCSDKLRTFGLDARNKKVQNHFFQRASIYQDAGTFWVEEWEQYADGKSKLPHWGQFCDDLFKRRDFYENQYLELKSD